MSYPRFRWSTGVVVPVLTVYLFVHSIMHWGRRIEQEIDKVFQHITGAQQLKGVCTHTLKHNGTSSQQEGLCTEGLCLPAVFVTAQQLTQTGRRLHVSILMLSFSFVVFWDSFQARKQPLTRCLCSLAGCVYLIAFVFSQSAVCVCVCVCVCVWYIIST